MFFVALSKLSTNLLAFLDFGLLCFHVSNPFENLVQFVQLLTKDNKGNYFQLFYPFDIEFNLI
jgi:hypothetical protein